MERRQGDRRPYRTQVRFTERGSEKRHLGYTTNVSDSGIFMTTNRLVPKGQRIRIELGVEEKGVVVEGVVARVYRSLHQLRPSGLGVRFLKPDEVLRELASEGGNGGVPDFGAAGLYRLRFAGRTQLAEVFRRDLATGGLFIPCEQLAELNAIVSVEISLADAPSLVRFQARVVHRLEPGAGPVTGMGVEILDFERTLAALRELVGPA